MAETTGPHESLSIPPEPSFGWILGYVRTHAHLSQKELAAACESFARSRGLRTRGFQPSAVAHWETGRRIPTPGQLRVLAQVLRADATVLQHLVQYAALQDTRYAAFIAANASATSAEFLIAWEQWSTLLE